MTEVTLTLTLPADKAEAILRFVREDKWASMFVANISKEVGEQAASEPEKPAEKTRGQKAAETRAKNKAKKEAEEAAAKEEAEPEKPTEEPVNDLDLDLDSLGGDAAPTEPPMSSAEFKAALVKLMQSEKGVNGHQIKKHLTDNYGVDNPAAVEEGKRRQLIAELNKLAG